MVLNAKPPENLAFSAFGRGRVVNLEEIVLLGLMARKGASPVELARDIGIPVWLVLEVFGELKEKGLLEELER